MVFRQERHQLPLRHLFGYQPCGQQGDAASRQSKAHQRRSAISRKPRRAGYREIHLCLVIRAQLPAQRRRQALVNNPLSLRQIGQRLHRMACQPGRRGDGQDRETGYPRRPIAGIGQRTEAYRHVKSF